MYECSDETCRPAKDCSFPMQAQKNRSLKGHVGDYMVPYHELLAQ